MQPYNLYYVPPRPSGGSEQDPNQSHVPNQPFVSVPTQPTAFGTGFVDLLDNNQIGFVDLLNQPVSWDPNQLGFNPNFNTGGYGSTQGEPDYVPVTQPKPSQRGKRAHNKKKDTGGRKAKNVQMWTADEEYALAQAWLNVSEDPLFANNQKKSLFWKRIRALFFGLVGKENGYRSNNSISGKWTDMKTKCQRFQSIYQGARNGWKSNADDEDIISAAIIGYQTKRRHFAYLKVWRLLRDSPKWANVLPLGGTSSAKSGNRRPSKKSKTSSVDPKTPTSDARNTDMNDISQLFAGEDEEAEMELRRPPGRRSGGKVRRPESSSGGIRLERRVCRDEPTPSRHKRPRGSTYTREPGSGRGYEGDTNGERY